MKKRPPRTGRPNYWEDAYWNHGYGPDAPRWECDPEMRASATRLADIWEQERYRETGNPLFVWRTYRYLRCIGAEVPEWVLAYLDHVAVNLLDSEEDVKDASFIARALDLDVGQGERSAFSDLENDGAMMYGRDVLRGLKAGGQETYVIEEVAMKHGVSTATVRRGWKKLQPIADLLDFT